MTTHLTNISAFFQAESLEKSMILLKRTNERTNERTFSSKHNSEPLCGELVDVLVAR